MVDKKVLRKEIVAKWSVGDSTAIAHHILNSKDFKEADSLFIYVSMDNEPDTKPIIEEAFKEKKRVFVPKCISKTEMIAVEIKDWDALQPRTLGILEPKENEPTSTLFDVGYVPCVSASKDGKRLGHGAGYYDRFLHASSMKKVCMCFEDNLCEEIPMDATDVWMDEVVTEEGFY